MFIQIGIGFGMQFNGEISKSIPLDAQYNNTGDVELNNDGRIETNN